MHSILSRSKKTPPGLLGILQASDHYRFLPAAAAAGALLIGGEDDAPDDAA